LKLKCDELLSNVAFNFNLRRYNEAEVGESLAGAMAAGTITRAALFVTSKLWNDRRRPDDVRAGLKQSLSDLQLDYVDLYLIHWPVVWRRGTLMQGDDGASIVECWRALEGLVDDGLCRAIGGALQLDSIKTRVESAPGVCNQSTRLKLKCDKPLSNVAFNVNVRRYASGCRTSARSNCARSLPRRASCPPSTRSRRGGSSEPQRRAPRLQDSTDIRRSQRPS
jgi:hypothetical protein